MSYATSGLRRGTALAASAVLSAVLAGCSHPAPASPAASTPAPATGTAPDRPGGTSIRAQDVDLDITRATAHLDAAGNGSLTMTVRNGSTVPEHLDMIATPDAGRGELLGAPHGAAGMMTSAGILIPAGTTVTFGSGGGPAVRLTAVHGVTATRTLPIALEFGVARLVRLSAVVPPG